MPRNTALRFGDVEDLVHLARAADVFELHASDRVLAACEVVGRPVSPHRPARDVAARAPVPCGGWTIWSTQRFASAASETWGTSSPSAPASSRRWCGCRCGQAPAPAPARLQGLRDDDRAVREVERQRAVLHVDDDEFEARGRQHLERLEAGELDPGAERRGPGSAQPVGDRPHGIGYSSALSDPAGPLGEVEPRRSEDVDQLMPHLVHALAGVHGRRRDHGDGWALRGLVVVVAPRVHVDGPRRADVVHVVTLELQRDLLEVVVVVRADSLCGSRGPSSG